MNELGFIKKPKINPNRPKATSVTVHAGYSEDAKEIDAMGDKLDVIADGKKMLLASDLRRRLCAAGYLPSALLSGEQKVRERPETWEKIRKEFNITLGEYQTICLSKELMNTLLNTRGGRQPGTVYDCDLYPKRMREDWLLNGFAASYYKDESDIVEQRDIFGEELGAKIHQVIYEIQLQSLRTQKDPGGGFFLGCFFFCWGLFALIMHWQFINFREVMRARFKFASRLYSSDAEATTQLIQQQKLMAKFLLSYYEEEDEDDEDEDDDEEEEEEEEESDE